MRSSKACISSAGSFGSAESVGEFLGAERASRYSSSRRSRISALSGFFSSARRYAAAAPAKSPSAKSRSPSCSGVAGTEVRVDASWPKFALLDINLLTGRTHQIRVHMAYLHHPVVGDTVYGGGMSRAVQTAPTNTARAAIEALSGQALHATRLAFTHPITQAPLEFTSPVPADMQRVINELDQSI